MTSRANRRGRVGTAWRALWCAAGLLAGVASAAARPTVPLPEYNVKAGFLTAFTKYVSWPPDSLGTEAPPIVIGVVGDDPFGSVLDRTAAADQGGRRLVIRRLRVPGDAAGCQVVFIPRSQNRNEASWLAALKGRPILTVGECEQTLARGAILAFVVADERVGFEANLRAMDQAHVKLSSDLLSHARRVYR